MPKIKDTIRGGLTIQLGADPSRLDRALGTPTYNQIQFGIVGHATETPQFVRLEAGQCFIEVTMEPQGDEIICRLGQPGSGDQTGWYIPLDFGCRVVIVMEEGDPNNAYIIARLHDKTCPFPSTVAGIDTGIDSVTDDSTAPAPMWHFLKTGPDQLLAIETGENGDFIVHSAANVEIKCDDSARIHLNGACSLGQGPTTAPTGATVGPNGETVPGVPAVADDPDSWEAPSPLPPAYVEFRGNLDSIIRAKEQTQFSQDTDPVGYTQFSLVYSHPLIGLPAPLVLIAQMRNASPVAQGSKHTASD